MPADIRRFRVLVVDDNRDAATVLVMLLSRSGFEATAVHSGQDALMVAEKFLPDCVISDIGMPGMDGYELARRIRSHPSLSAVVLVALSAYGDSEKVHAAGFDHHLLKPASSEDVTRLLRRFESS